MLYRAKVVQPYSNGFCRVVIPQLYGETLVTITRFGSNLPLNPGMGWVSFEGDGFSYPIWVSSDPTVADQSSATSSAGLYGAYSSYQDQTLAAADTATLMTLDTDDGHSGVTLVNGTRLTVVNAGVYNFQWSGQFANTDTQEHDISIWIRINTVDVAGSTGVVGIPGRHGNAVDGHIVAGWNFILPFESGDFLELVWSADDVHVSLQTYALAAAPSTASLVVTLQAVADTGLPGPPGPAGLSTDC